MAESAPLTSWVQWPRQVATILGAAIGDAMGAPLEGHAAPERADVLRLLEADEHRRYTDDTALTIALAESLLYCGGLDQDHLARSFVAAWEREPDRGYGAGTATLLATLATGGSWLALAPAQFGGTGSYGNGAAMRSSPIGLMAGGDLRRAGWLAARGAVVTHTHADATAGAAVQAAAVAHLLAGGPAGARDLVDALLSVDECLPLRGSLEAVADLDTDTSPREVARRLGHGVAARESVPAALAAFTLNRTSFVDVVVFALEIGGDTDTIASMAGGLAGTHLGLGAIPEEWVVRLERADRLVEIASRLSSRWPLV